MNTEEYILTIQSVTRTVDFFILTNMERVPQLFF